MDQIEDRVAVVTGAGSGIGLAIADALAAAGCHVVVSDIDSEAASAAADRIRAHGTTVEALQLDVRDPDAVDRAAATAVDRLGAVNIAVNNAGVVNRGRSWELSLEDWRHVLDVNLWGVIHGVRAFVPRILASGQEGHVVNIASMAAVHAIAELGPYTVAKHGVLGLSDVLRAELDPVTPLVGVSVVLPGRIRTGMNPIGAIEPERVAANVLDALRRRRPYVFTDGDSTGEVRARFDAISAARDDVLP
jgi:NAD(P)-dependent dehydrogenase (short-subunit alcohol dehydrogenase family)